jgi:hypothetical protein
MPSGVKQLFARPLFTIVTVACLFLLVPRPSRAGLIVDSSLLFVEAGQPDQELSRLEEVPDFIAWDSLRAEPDITLQGHDAAQLPLQPDDGAEIESFTICSGGMTSVPPHVERDLGSFGIESGRSDRVRLSLFGCIKMGLLFVPNSPLADRLLDPPKCSS